MSSKVIRAQEAVGVPTFQWEGESCRSRSSPLFSAAGGITADEFEAMVAQRIAAEREASFQEGVRQGQAAGRQEAQSQLDVVNHNMAASLAQLASFRKNLRRQAEGQVVELALAVARKILHRQIQIDPDAILGLVKAALERIDARELLEIRVAGLHHAAAKQGLERLGCPAQVQVIADASLEPGAILLDTDRGRLDGSIETQLDEIGRGFADYLHLEAGR